MASIAGEPVAWTVDLTAVTPTAPIVTSDPSSQAVTAGNSVSLVAAAVGSPAPTVQWQLSTDGGNTFTNIAGATSTKLTFTTASGQNDNEYQAVFTNSSGSATTTPATLTVNTTSAVWSYAATGVFPQFALTYLGTTTVFSNGNILAVGQRVE